MEALSREEIKEIIPHRDPFLFLDRMEEVQLGKRGVGIIEDVARYAHITQGHFPGYPVLPGAILIEALAEVGAVLALGLEENRGKLAMLTGVEHCRFRRPATPGKSLRLEVELIQSRGRFGRGRGRATSGAELLAEADLLFAIVDKPPGML